MRKFLSSTILLAVMVLLAVSPIWSAEDLNTEYLMSVGDYFDVSYDEVDAIASSDISIDEVPTVFLMAQLSKMSPKDVLATKLNNKITWATFMVQNYIHQSEVLIDIYRFDTPECKAIGDKIKNKPLSSVKFDDKDINVMVNYKFISKTNNIKYSDLINNRNIVDGKQKSFVDINHASYDPSSLAQTNK